jgi:hypothetical protein
LAQAAGGGQVSVLGPRFNASEYLSMRVEDPVRRGGLNLGPAFLPRRPRREILNQNPNFEMAYSIFNHLILFDLSLD